MSGTFDFRGTSGALTTVLGRYVSRAPTTPIINNFTPSTGQPGIQVTITGVNFTGATEVRFGGVITISFTVVNATTITAIVPIGAITGVVRVVTPVGFNVSLGQFAVGSSFLDGPSTILAAAFTLWQSQALVMPDYAAIPAGRRVTAGMTFASLQTALNTASAMTGGERLVIVPHNFNAKGRLAFGINASPTHRVYVAWEHMVNGTFVALRDVRMPHTEPAGIPTLETIPIGSDLQPVIDFGDGGVEWEATPTDRNDVRMCNYYLAGLNIRVAADALPANYCRNLILHGNLSHLAGGGGLPSKGPSELPNKNVLSHCYVGGRAFQPDGKWREVNIGRAVYQNGGSFALLDSCDLEHGSIGSTGSDRGILSGIYGLGPTIVRNLYSDLGGGICFLHGGDDSNVEPWPAYADFELLGCLIRRDLKYHPTLGQSDSAGMKCPWATKNQYETKNGDRQRAHRNVFLNYWTGVAGQTHACYLKSVQQDGFGRVDSANDQVFTENLIITLPQSTVARAFGINGLETYRAADRLNGMNRTQIRGNVLIFSDGGHGYSIRASPPGDTTLRKAVKDVSVVENLIHCHVPHSGQTSEVSSRTGGFDGTLTVSRNLYTENAGYRLNGESDDGAGAAGLNAHLADRYMTGGAAAIIAVDNAVVTPGGVIPSTLWNLRGAAQKYYTSDTAMGLVKTGTGIDTRFNYAVNSPLLTAAAGGTRIGPDLAVLNPVWAAVISGDVRGFI